MGNLRVLLVGCLGTMGKVFARVAAASGGFEIAAGADAGAPEDGGDAGIGFPVCRGIAGASAPADVIVDFSRPAALPDILACARARRLPAVLAATGYSDGQLLEIRDAARELPIFQSYNMSVGVSLMAELARKAASVLGDAFDAELVEAHHNKKVDAPSGTALMIAGAVNEASGGGMEYVYERKSRRERRGKRELGIHSVRGGTVVGEHSLLFLGNDEVLEIRHAAASKDIFAEGALRAARFVASPGLPPGLYGMKDLLGI